MNFQVARGILDVIKTERSRRNRLLSQQNDDLAYDQWHFEDLPFINELCLTLLVGLFHQIERELVYKAARVDDTADLIAWDAWMNQVQTLRERARTNGVGLLLERLGYADVPDWLKTLRLIANCFKHEPSMKPDERLLTHLGMPLRPTESHIVAYASLPESSKFLEALALSVGVVREDYCLIAAEFISKAETLLKEVEVNPRVKPVERRVVSMSEYEG